MRRPVLLVAAALALLALGAALGRLLLPVAAPAEIRLACRPSAPWTATEAGTGPVALFLGNSLVFDHDWRVPGGQVVNCARQGLTAAAFPEDDLPRLDPRLVVLGFGTVELVRGATPAEAPALAEDISRVIDAVETRYPEAALLLLGPPPHGEGPARDALEAELATLADARGVDFAPLPGARTYDGIHLVPEAYADWDRAVIRAFAAASR